MMWIMPEKKWVFDTVALSNFLLSESVFLLEKRYFKRGIITWQVYDEISAGISDYPELRAVKNLIDEKAFELLTLTRAEHKHFLEMIVHLGKGKASCIALAKERNAIVVTDDRAARRQCAQVEIPVTGTLGILKASLLDGHIDLDLADKILSNMIEAGFFSPVRSIADIV
jgi:predicted nucleic acid-binding protein